MATSCYVCVGLHICIYGSTSCYVCVGLHLVMDVWFSIYIYIYIYIYISLQILVVRIVDILKVSIYCNTLCAKHNLQV